LLEEVPDVAARLGGDRVVEPGGVRACSGRGDYLDGLPALQRFRERRQAAVDATGDTAVAQFRVHRVGKVHGGRAARQFHDVALGREHVDLVGEQVDLDVLDKLQTVAGSCCISSNPCTQRRARAWETLALSESVLYSQCAAMPLLAMSSISWVRIWISIGTPCIPMVTVCSDW
jgi:hypothetical protein